MPTILNIGAPYVGLTGGDKQRARFEEVSLSGVYDQRFAYVESAASGTDKEAPPNGAPTIFYRLPAGLWPRTVATYSAPEVEKLRAELVVNTPDVLFVRHIAATPLVPRVLDLLPRTKIVIDVDMLISRISQQTWQRNRSIRNRYFLFSAWHTSGYERWLFNQPFLFLMSNEEEVEFVRKRVLWRNARSRFVVVPNPMPEVWPRSAVVDPAPQERYILFHGVLSSAVNVDAYRFLARDIYPRIAGTLEALDAYIHVVGRGMTPEYEALAARHSCHRIRLIGAVEDIGRAIRNAEFCLVPLRMGSGTKTRILEVAAHGNTVLTTPLGVEGLRFDETEIVVRESAEELAGAAADLLSDGDKRRCLADNLQRRSIALYSESTVAQDLLDAIASYEALHSS